MKINAGRHLAKLSALFGPVRSGMDHQDVRERAPVAGCRYQAFVDPSGGRADSFTMAIGHAEDERAVLDLVRETRPPFSPESVVGEYASFLRSYGVARVRSDRYAGIWPREQFRKRGIEYLPAEKAKSDLYVALLPAINSGRVDLLDNERLVAQLAGLERRTCQRQMVHRGRHQNLRGRLTCNDRHSSQPCRF
jgi:hypothetical protein